MSFLLVLVVGSQPSVVWFTPSEYRATNVNSCAPDTTRKAYDLVARLYYVPVSWPYRMRIKLREKRVYGGIRDSLRTPQVLGYGSGVVLIGMDYVVNESCHCNHGVFFMGTSPQ